MWDCLQDELAEIFSEYTWRADDVTAAMESWRVSRAEKAREYNATRKARPVVDIQKHREDQRRRSAAKRAANPEHYRNYMREYMREYISRKTQENPNFVEERRLKSREANRRWREKNKANEAARVKAWRAARRAA